MGRQGWPLLSLMALGSPLMGSPLLSLQTMVEKGYETGLHAPGLRLQGTGLYVAAHHIIKVSQIHLGRGLGSRWSHGLGGHVDPLPHQYVTWALLLRICRGHLLRLISSQSLHYVEVLQQLLFVFPRG